MVCALMATVALSQREGSLTILLSEQISSGAHEREALQDHRLPGLRRAPDPVSQLAGLMEALRSTLIRGSQAPSILVGGRLSNQPAVVASSSFFKTHTHTHTHTHTQPHFQGETAFRSSVAAIEDQWKMVTRGLVPTLLCSFFRLHDCFLLSIPVHRTSCVRGSALSSAMKARGKTRKHLLNSRAIGLSKEMNYKNCYSEGKCHVGQDTSSHGKSLS